MQLEDSNDNGEGISNVKPDLPTTTSSVLEVRNDDNGELIARENVSWEDGHTRIRELRAEYDCPLRVKLSNKDAAFERVI